MGHERIGYLPRSKSWRDIVNDIGRFSEQNPYTNKITQGTLRQVRARFEHLEKDPSVISAFRILLEIAFAFKMDDPIKYLRDRKLINSSELSPIQLAISIHNNNPIKINSNEYNTISKQAAIDAINCWYTANKPKEENLFSNKLNSEEILSRTANGSGFCELSRLFFSKFTERYLKYFLEREASSVVAYSNRVLFNNEIEKHIDLISKHAFETSKITESFAAGWFNKNVKTSFPSDKQIKGFLSYAFHKIANELLREEIN